ncbi:zinc ribbon domain-containing protein [Loigolactobacillus coryniformis]|uniref:zinc ribbon domain-containing protein n=1 Tax=Loigolactobacillus coryniformis TaxID=1610 RepID=UPI003F2587A2
MKQIAKKMWAMDFGSLGVGEFICPSCGQPVTLQEGKCAHCGYDLVAYRHAHGIVQPPLSSAASAATSARANFGTINFGSSAVAVAKPAARQLLPADVIEFDAATEATSVASSAPVKVATSTVPSAPSVASAAIRETTSAQVHAASSGKPTVASTATADNTASLAALVAQVQSNQAVVNQMLAQLQSDQAALRQLADSVATSAASAAASAAIAPRPRQQSWLTRLLQRFFKPRQRQLPPPK